jgi:hypothetical protein
MEKSIAKDHDNNIIIAVFMGLVYRKSFYPEMQPNKIGWYYSNGHAYNGKLRYNKDWNELMKVVQSAYDTDIEGNIIGDITHALVDCDREKTYEAVVEFIKFYNQR